jgi:hypothetical protein
MSEPYTYAHHLEGRTKTPKNELGAQTVQQTLNAHHCTSHKKSPPPMSSNSSLVSINASTLACRRRYHDAKRCHHPTGVYHPAFIVEAPLHYAAKTRRHRW